MSCNGNEINSIRGIDVFSGVIAKSQSKQKTNRPLRLITLMSTAMLSWSFLSQASTMSASDARSFLEVSLVIMDGGMGRELERLGAPFKLPLWSADALMKAPDCVHTAHENFINSGAELIITNSYACVPFHLGEEMYQRSGVDLASQAGKNCT